MDLTIAILLAIVIILLIGILTYLAYFLPKKEKELLNLRLIQKKETSEIEESKNEKVIKTSLELKKKIEEISQELKISKEVSKTLLENIDKGIKGEISNQQKLFSERNKELSERFNKDLEFRLNSNQQLIKTNLENLNKGISQPLEKLNSVLLQSDERGK